jgi:hypothetical protein
MWAVMLPRVSIRTWSTSRDSGSVMGEALPALHRDTIERAFVLRVIKSFFRAGIGGMAILNSLFGERDDDFRDNCGMTNKPLSWESKRGGYFCIFRTSRSH